MSLERKIQNIANFYGVKVRFIKNGTPSYDFRSKQITVPLNLRRQVLISSFCHELGHFLNQQNNKYRLYHNHEFPEIMKRFKGSYWKTAAYVHRAELYTDQVGAQLCQQYFPRITFWGGYSHNPKASLGFVQSYYIQYCE